MTEVFTDYFQVSSSASSLYSAVYVGLNMKAAESKAVFVDTSLFFQRVGRWPVIAEEGPVVPPLW